MQRIDRTSLVRYSPQAALPELQDHLRHILELRSNNTLEMAAGRVEITAGFSKRRMEGVTCVMTSAAGSQPSNG